MIILIVLIALQTNYFVLLLTWLGLVKMKLEFDYMSKVIRKNKALKKIL